MIIGNGLIGSALKKTLKHHENLLVFVSGVANSKEEDFEQYKKEFTLLEETLKIYKGKKLIYFSTCSISLKNESAYIKHKKNIENYICNNVDDYLIIRIPNIVGNSTNKHQLVNYFLDCLINQISITINVDCIRYLIDVDDLSKIIELLVTSKVKPSIINAAFDNGIKLEELLMYLEDATEITFKEIIKVSKGIDYTIDNAAFLKLIKNESYFNSNAKVIVNKYFTKNDKK